MLNERTLVLFTESKIALLLLEYRTTAMGSGIWLAAIVVVVGTLVQIACLDSVFLTSFTVLKTSTKNHLHSCINNLLYTDKLCRHDQPIS